MTQQRTFPENVSQPTPEPAESEHKVAYLSGGRTDEKWTAQCSCGKRFESTHNYRLRSSVTRHLNKANAGVK